MSYKGSRCVRGSMPNFFVRAISVVRLISIRAAAPFGASYSFACDFQDADNLLAFMGFARAHHHRGVPAIVAQFADRSLERRTAGKDHRTLDEVFQLANISRPMPTGELPQGRSRNGFDLLLHAAAILLREVADQERNVSGTFAQRWDADRKHVQAIVQVAAELAILHHLLQVAIRCRYETNIHSSRVGASQPLKLPFLQGPQQFGLDLDRNVPNLVQEERATVGKFEAA